MSLSDAQREQALQKQHQALRWTFIGTGITHPEFLRTVERLSPAGVVEAIQQDASLAKACFEVETVWQGQTRSETRVREMTLGGQPLDRKWKIQADEPLELLGSNAAPNPQELLLAGLNSCILVGYVAGAAVHGIELESVSIVTKGEIDLRGFLALDDTVPVGYDGLEYTVQIKGDGTPEQFEAIHEHVKKTSPNYFNLNQAIAMNAKLEVK